MAGVKASASFSVEASVAHFVADVLVEFKRSIADLESLMGRLTAMGVDDAAAATITQFVQGRGPDVQKLSEAATRFAAELESSDPDFTRLLPDIASVWTGITGLAGAAPPVQLVGAVAPVNIIELILGDVIDVRLRRISPLAWSLGAALGVFGTPRSPIDAFVAAYQHPLQFALARILEYRRVLSIEVAGLLTGPRTTAWSVDSLGEGLAVPAPIAAAIPNSHRIVERIDLALAADTFGDPIHVTLDVVATAAGGFAGIALTVSPLAADKYKLGAHLEFGLSPLDQPLSVALTGFGSVAPIVPNPPTLALTTTLTTGIQIGDDGGIHVVLAEPVLETHVGSDGWRAAAGFRRFELVVPADALGPILTLLLPRDGIRLRGQFVLAVDENGAHLDGGVGLEARSPHVLRLPGIIVSDLTTGLDISGDGLGLRAAGTLTVNVGPLAVTVQGLGASLALAPGRPGRANLAIAHLSAPEFLPLTGFGIRVNAGIVRGGGFLKYDGARGEYAGALELSLALGPVELSIKAFGVFGSTGGSLSFVVVLSMEFSPPIELFLGLTLNGVGGVFGFNRTIDTGAVGELVRSGRADDLLFPRDVVGRAPAIIDAVNRVFPARRDQVVVGPLLKLGWGRPTSFVTLTVGLLVTFPDPSALVIIGRLRVALPDESAPIIDLRADFVGTIEFTTGNVSFDASLNNSRIGTFSVGGDLALRAGPQGFVFSAGGFHPRFQPPAALASMRRLSIDVSPPALIKIWAEAYVAVTASSFQFGARAFLVAELGPIDARGNLGLDVLIQTEPRLAFMAEISGDFSLRAGGYDIASARVNVLLEGPGRWHARASASIEVLFFSVSGSIDLDWGDEPADSLKPPVVPAELARRAVDGPAEWVATVAPADGAVVSLREGARGLHPLGSLRLAQNAVPLGVSLQRVGASRVISADPVTVTTTVAGGRAETTRDLFATAQYFDLTDEERLSRPSFVPYDSGVLVTGDGWTPGTARSLEVVYEENLGENEGKPFLEVASDGMLAWMCQAAVLRAAGQHATAGQGSKGGATAAGAVGRARLSAAGSLSDSTAFAAVAVAEPRYLVIDATSGVVVTPAGEWGDLFGTINARPVDRLLVAEFEVLR